VLCEKHLSKYGAALVLNLNHVAYSFARKATEDSSGMEYWTTWFGGLPPEPNSSHQKLNGFSRFYVKRPLYLSPQVVVWRWISRCRTHWQHRIRAFHIVKQQSWIKQICLSHSHIISFLKSHLAHQVVTVCKRTRNQDFYRSDG